MKLETWAVGITAGSREYQEEKACDKRHNNNNNNNNNNNKRELQYLLATVMSAIQAEDRQQRATFQAQYQNQKKH